MYKNDISGPDQTSPLRSKKGQDIWHAGIWSQYNMALSFLLRVANWWCLTFHMSVDNLNHIQVRNLIRKY